jgi:hypothetical protein
VFVAGLICVFSLLCVRQPAGIGGGGGGGMGDGGKRVGGREVRKDGIVRYKVSIILLLLLLFLMSGRFSFLLSLSLVLPLPLSLVLSGSRTVRLKVASW